MTQDYYGEGVEVKYEQTMLFDVIFNEALGGSGEMNSAEFGRQRHHLADVEGHHVGELNILLTKST